VAVTVLVARACSCCPFLFPGHHPPSLCPASLSSTRMLCEKAYGAALQEASCLLSLPFVLNCGVLVQGANRMMMMMMVPQALALPDPLLLLRPEE
jgi:hypothetical protein